MNLKKLLGTVIVLAAIGWVVTTVDFKPWLAMLQADDGEDKTLLEQCIAAQMRRDRRITHTEARKYCQSNKRQPLIQ